MEHLLSLGLILGAFIAMIVAVMWLAFRGRRMARQRPGADEADGSSDGRILAVIFGSMLAAMVLAVVAGYLVFGHG